MAKKKLEANGYYVCEVQFEIWGKTESELYEATRQLDKRVKRAVANWKKLVLRRGMKLPELKIVW